MEQNRMNKGTAGLVVLVVSLSVVCSDTKMPLGILGDSIADSISVEAPDTSPIFTKEKLLLGQGTVYETEYWILKGSEEGPVVFINGGLHGDEIAGVYAAESLLTLTITKGTLTVMPRMNRRAVEKRLRQIGDNDLNRAFLGNPKGTIEEQIAWEVTQMVGREKVDLVLSLHESWRLHSESTGKGCGQTIITGIEPTPELLQRAISRVNSWIDEPDLQFSVYCYPVGKSISEQLVAEYGLQAYCVDSYLNFELEERIRVLYLACIAFLDEIGVEYVESEKAK